MTGKIVAGLLGVVVAAAVSAAAPQEIIETGLAQAREQHHAGSGSAWLCDVKTGETVFRSKEFDLRQLELVSLVKPLVAITALEEKVVKLDTVIDCTRTSDMKIRDVRDFGKATVAEIVAGNFNIGIVRIARLLDRKKLESQFRTYHFEFGGDWDRNAIGWGVFATPEQVIQMYVALAPAWKKYAFAGPVPATILRVMQNGTSARRSDAVGFVTMAGKEYLLWVNLNDLRGPFYYAAKTAVPTWEEIARKLRD